MAAIYLKSGVATARINSTAYVLGDKVVIDRADTTANYLVIRKWVMECTTAGTSGAAVPAWPATVAQDTDTLVDDTVTWTFRKPGFSSGTTPNWAFSTIYADYAISALLTGETLYVSNNHAESAATSLVNLAANCIVISANDAAAPPTAVTTTSSISTTLGTSLRVIGQSDIYGLQFNAGSGSNNANLTINDTPGAGMKFTGCDFNLLAAGSGSRLLIGLNSNDAVSETTWANCRASFGSAAQAILVRTGAFNWVGGSVFGATPPNNLFFFTSAGEGGIITVSGCDFSVLPAAANLIASGIVQGGKAVFTNIRVPASWTGDLVNGDPARGFDAEMYNYDSGATNYRFLIKRHSGSIRQETVIVMTGGTSDGTTAYSAKMTSSANAKEFIPLISQTWRLWNETTAAAKTLTVEIIHDSTTALTDSEVWVRARYLGNASYPLGSEVSDVRATLLTTPAAQTASTVAWTTTGLTDPNKQKLEVTFTPQMKGEIEFEICLAKASYTIYANIPTALT